MANVENKQNLRNTVKAAIYISGFVWREKIGKLFVFFRIIKSVSDALFPLVYIFIPGWIINELTGSQRRSQLVLYIALLVSVPFVQYIFNSFMDWILLKISMIIILKIDALFYEHVTEMDFETLEMPNIQIMKDRAQSTLQGNSVGIVNQVSDLFSSVISVIAIASIISTLNPLIVLLIVAITIINSLFRKRINRRRYQEDKERWAFQRRVNIWEDMLKAKQHAKQLRIFNLKSFLIKKSDCLKSGRNR